VKCKHEGCPTQVPYSQRDYHPYCDQHKGDKYKPSSSSSSSSSSSHECSIIHFLTPSSSSSHSHLSAFQRGAVAALHAVGHSVDDIAVYTRASEKTIKKWIDRAHDDMKLEDIHRSGRPSKLDSQQRKRIRERAEDRPFVVPKMIKYEQDLHVCPRTIDRSLIADGLYGRVAKKQPAYTPAKLRARFAFGKAFEHWTKEQWARVVFSDETSFPLGPECHGRPRVRRPKGKAFDPKYIWNDEAAVHSGTVKLFFAFSATERCSLGVYEGALTGKKMKSIVQEHLHPFVHRIFADGQYYVVHDNDTR